MRKYCCLSVEGQHDAIFIYRLLSVYGLERVEKLQDLDEYFLPSIPKSYPVNGDLLKRMPIPLFLQNQSHSIAIYLDKGDSQLVSILQKNLQIYDLSDFTGIGILIDTDKETSASNRYALIKNNLNKSMQLDLATNPGIVLKGLPNIGAFVLPDNSSAGTLENLLISSAEQTYPILLDTAKQFVIAAQNANISVKELKDFNKPSGKNKAIIGAMANILRPGKAMQVSVQDNQWLKGNALNIPEIKAVQCFLTELFEIEKTL